MQGLKCTLPTASAKEGRNKHHEQDHCRKRSPVIVSALGDLVLLRRPSSPDNDDKTTEQMQDQREPQLWLPLQAVQPASSL